MVPIKTTLTGLAVAAAIGGATLGASPALAVGGSTCTYNPDTKAAIIDDHSGNTSSLAVRVVGGQIRIVDGFTGSNGLACPIPGTPLGSATVFNTDRIAIFASGVDISASDGVTIDMRDGFLGPGATPEQDGSSEIEVAFNTPGIPAPITVNGTGLNDPVTHGNDQLRVGAGGKVNLGYRQFVGSDQDVDITPTTSPSRVALAGLDGEDLLTGGGNELTGNPGPATFRLDLDGNGGKDRLEGGRGGDQLRGGPDADRYDSVDTTLDFIRDFGLDPSVDFAVVDTLDNVTGVEQKVVVPPATP